MLRRELAEALHREYMDFFEKAERNRRWNIWDDVPWEELDQERRHPELALCAETFLGVEMYVPDYIAQGLECVRDSSKGQAWFQACWGYEESKHSLVLREYLLRSGHRSPAAMYDFEQAILEKRWARPFEAVRQMTMYGIIQEMATLVIYKKQSRRAMAAGDKPLTKIFQLIARDEAAHARFYINVVNLLMAEDRDGCVADLAHVFRNFQMPGVELVPEYDARVEVMRAGGVDRGVFIEEVWFPIIKRLGVTRRELARAARQRAEREAKKAEAAEGTGLEHAAGGEGGLREADVAS
ncbi:MAG TPA: acyl-ACP desaturase [Myxococcota bacterium]|jgi:acyl-[acyl-carrier-protein] desaturase|nr:acyl-ACP desaturase [Myxococcota bacterium]